MSRRIQPEQPTTGGRSTSDHRSPYGAGSSHDLSRQQRHSRLRSESSQGWRTENGDSSGAEERERLHRLMICDEEWEEWIACLRTREHAVAEQEAALREREARLETHEDAAEQRWRRLLLEREIIARGLAGAALTAAEGGGRPRGGSNPGAAARAGAAVAPAPAPDHAGPENTWLMSSSTIPPDLAARLRSGCQDNGVVIPGRDLPALASIMSTSAGELLYVIHIWNVRSGAFIERAYP